METTLHYDGKPIPSSHIFNFDETNFSDDPGSKRAIFKRGVKYPERIKDSTKTSISVMFCGSADGIIIPPYVVYKADGLFNSWTENGPPKTRYNRTKSGWFDSRIFLDWFESAFLVAVKSKLGRNRSDIPVVLIGDNLSSHFSPDVISLALANNVRFVCLPRNSTHISQPLDVAFFGPLKRQWRKVLDKWKDSNKKKKKNLNKDDFPKLLRGVLVQYILN